MTDANREPKALLIMLPQTKSDIRSPISLRLYHVEIRKTAPGKKAASANPRIMRVTIAPNMLSIEAPSDKFGK
jgi:hypothetical protein